MECHDDLRSWCARPLPSRLAAFPFIALSPNTPTWAVVLSSCGSIHGLVCYVGKLFLHCSRPPLGFLKGAFGRRFTMAIFPLPPRAATRALSVTSPTLL